MLKPAGLPYDPNLEFSPVGGKERWQELIPKERVLVQLNGLTSKRKTKWCVSSPVTRSTTTCGEIVRLSLEISPIRRRSLPPRTSSHV